MGTSIGAQINNLLTYSHEGFEYFKYHIRLFGRSLFFRDISEYIDNDQKHNLIKLFSFWGINIIAIYLIAYMFNSIASPLPFNFSIKIDIPVAHDILKYLPTIMIRHLLGLIVFCYILRMGFTKKEFSENKTKLIKIFLISSTFILAMFIYSKALGEICENYFDYTVPNLLIFGKEFILHGFHEELVTKMATKVGLLMIFSIFSNIFWDLLWFSFIVSKIAKLNIVSNKKKISVKLIKALILFSIINIILAYSIESIELLKKSPSSRIIMFEKIGKAVTKEPPDYNAAADFAGVIARDHEAPDIIRYYALIKEQVLTTAMHKHTDPEFINLLKEYLPFILSWRYNEHQSERLNFWIILLELREYLKKQIREYPNDLLTQKMAEGCIEELQEAEELYRKNDSFKSIRWTKGDNNKLSLGVGFKRDSRSTDFDFEQPSLTLEPSEEGGYLLSHKHHLKGDMNMAFLGIFENVKKRSLHSELAEKAGEELKKRFIKSFLQAKFIETEKTTKESLIKPFKK